MTDTMFPCLWFNGNAKEAADFYCSVFPDARIESENPVVVMFVLNGKRFMGLNGGPQYQFTEAVSFVVNCKDQQEIDYFWDKLTAGGGEPGKCGWLKDRFGLSWQIVPANLGSLMTEPQRAGRVMQRLMKMNKLIVTELEGA